MCCFILLSLPHTHADRGSIVAVLFLLAQPIAPISAQDVMKL